MCNNFYCDYLILLYASEVVLSVNYHERGYVILCLHLPMPQVSISPQVEDGGVTRDVSGFCHRCTPRSFNHIGSVA